MKQAGSSGPSEVVAMALKLCKVGHARLQMAKSCVGKTTWSIVVGCDCNVLSVKGPNEHVHDLCMVLPSFEFGGSCSAWREQSCIG